MYQPQIQFLRTFSLELPIPVLSTLSLSWRHCHSRSKSRSLTISHRSSRSSMNASNQPHTVNRLCGMQLTSWRRSISLRATSITNWALNSPGRTSKSKERMKDQAGNKSSEGITWSLCGLHTLWDGLRNQQGLGPSYKRVSSTYHWQC